MKIKSLKLVFFSPTGTTKSVIQKIADGIKHEDLELIDITRPEARKKPLTVNEDDLLIVGVPVYMGRVPAIISEWLYSIKANNTPTVCLVVYGSRAYDDALLELKDILIKCGCKPIAGVSYIGEHSFSSDELPSSVGRPDESDLHYAELAGIKINDTIISLLSANQITDLQVPGNYPYGGATELWHVDFIAVSSECTQCGICAEECPAGAIDKEKSYLIDKDKCILCCACIKHCPQSAKTMKPGLVKDASIRVHERYNNRKEPESFFLKA
jgi:ferredoxin